MFSTVQWRAPRLYRVLTRPLPDPSGPSEKVPATRMDPQESE